MSMYVNLSIRFISFCIENIFLELKFISFISLGIQRTKSFHCSSRYVKCKIRIVFKKTNLRSKIVQLAINIIKIKLVSGSECEGYRIPFIKGQTDI